MHVQLHQGQSIGAIWLLAELARELGITSALGSERAGRLALWQVLARAIDQGSRLSAVRLARVHACGILDLPRFDEDDLYQNLGWLTEQQEFIEKTLLHTLKQATTAHSITHRAHLSRLRTSQHNVHQMDCFSTMSPAVIWRVHVTNSEPLATTGTARRAKARLSLVYCAMATECRWALRYFLAILKTPRQ